MAESPVLLLSKMNFPLYLVRHGEAGFAATDAQRPLTDRGRAHVEEVAKRFVEQQMPLPAMILASPLLRAQQTAEIWAAVLGNAVKIVTEPMVVPEGNIISFSRKLADQDQPWLVASHFPFVPGLASYLLAGQKDRVHLSVPTGTIISLEPEAEPERAGAYRMLGLDS